MAEQPNPYAFPTSVYVSSSVTIKLSENNYLLWKTQMESLLMSPKLLGFVNGQIPPPLEQVTTIVNDAPVQTPNPRFEEWTCLKVMMCLTPCQPFQSQTSDREWIADFGASAHMISSTSQMPNATPYNGPEHIMVDDGNFLPITHVGSTTLTTDTGSLPLNDVLICPSMQKSLLFVSELCGDYPCGVFFDSNAVYVIDLDTQKVVTKGPRNKGLYVLERKEFVAYFSNHQCAASDMVWHQRLGHVNCNIPSCDM